VAGTAIGCGNGRPVPRKSRARRPPPRQLPQLRQCGRGGGPALERTPSKARRLSYKDQRELAALPE